MSGTFLHDVEYARPTVHGRSHATRHHFVPERFFGRSANRPGTTRPPIFAECPWGVEGSFETFCYECHEEFLHNPVILPPDVKAFVLLCASRGLTETTKTRNREAIRGRIKLLHEIIEAGLRSPRGT
jgi:hypothetical protein